MMFLHFGAKQVGLRIGSRIIDRRGLIALIALAFVFFSFGIAVRTAYANPENISRSGKHVLTVYDNGETRGILTTADTLKEALEAGEIAIGEHDRTEPALDEKLVAANYDVTIYRARPVAVHDQGTVTKVMTPYHTASQIAKQAGIKLQDEDKATLQSSDDVVSDGAVEKLVIERATKFTLVFYGERATEHTMGTTVADMLAEKDIELGDNDRISPKLSQPIVAGMTVDLWREGKQTVTREEVIEHPVRQIEDADQKVGYRKVQAAGVDGEKLVTYEVIIKNGKELSKRALKTVVVKEAKEQVEVIGTKNNYSGSLNEWLLALRTCETGNTYNRNSGNGYYGAYQFLPSTWNSIASKTGRNDLVGVMPHQAAPADQDAMVVANANMTAGLSTQHPGCYSKLGLSNKPPQ